MKKKLNRVLFSGLSLSLLFLLTGCVSRDSNGNPTGTIWYILGEPMAKLIQYFANNVGLGFGLAIILVTIIVRCIILPLGLYQSWKASYQSEKMRSEEHTSELQSQSVISYAVFCLDRKSVV